MDAQTTELRWKRLTGLLAPFHEQALATARRLCRSSADGDDLYQEAVLRAFEKLHTLRDESRFRSWFYATLLSRHRSRHRRGFWRRLVPMSDAFPEGCEPIGEDGSGWSAEARRSNRAARALSALAAVQREAIVLFEIDGYSIDEIAAMQQVTISAVKSRLTRGRDRLRRFYEREGTLEDRVNGATEESARMAGLREDDRYEGPHARLAMAPAIVLSGKEESHE